MGAAAEEGEPRERFPREPEAAFEPVREPVREVFEPVEPAAPSYQPEARMPEPPAEPAWTPPPFQPAEPAEPREPVARHEPAPEPPARSESAPTKEPSEFEGLEPSRLHTRTKRRGPRR
jgi:hypothetical protein